MMEIKHDPESPPDHKDDQYAGERHRSEVLKRRGVEPYVKKEPEMYQNLHDRGDGDDN